MLQVSCGAETVQVAQLERTLASSNPRALVVAIRKDMRAVRCCFNKILQFLAGVLASTGWLYNGHYGPINGVKAVERTENTDSVQCVRESPSGSSPSSSIKWLQRQLVPYPLLWLSDGTTCKIKTKNRRLKNDFTCRLAEKAPRAGTPGYRAPEVLMKYPHQTTGMPLD